MIADVTTNTWNTDCRQLEYSTLRDYCTARDHSTSREYSIARDCDKTRELRGTNIGSYQGKGSDVGDEGGATLWTVGVNSAYGGSIIARCWRSVAYFRSVSAARRLYT